MKTKLLTPHVFQLKEIGIILLVILSFYGQVNSQTLPAGFSRVTVASGMNTPVVMDFAPDGRIFVGQQGGDVRIIKNGTLLPTPFAHVDVHFTGERGLIGITLDPNFSSNGFVYLYYTLPNGSANRISRFTANGDVAIANSKVDILTLDPLSGATNHNGGAMKFKDGKLYVAVGENANGAHSQNLDTYHGKILRLNSDGTPAAGNPFPTGSVQRRSVWAYGFRNPFTFDVQPGTGRLFVNDVGGNYEEINDVTNGGGNYGWPTVPHGNSTNAAFVNPKYFYERIGSSGNENQGCAITGGTFLNSSASNYPSQYIGKYFFVDWCSTWINYIDPASGAKTNFASGNGGSALGIDVGLDGNLYFLRRDGLLYKIVYTNHNAPAFTSQPANLTVSQGQSATFSVTASGALPLNYQWQKNGVNISGANGASYTIPNTTTSDAGQYRAVVSNSFGTATSNTATLTVTAFNAAPVAQIIAPTSDVTYAGGQTISFSGNGTDQEDGTLPASAFTWRIDFHHNTHTHPGPAIAAGIKSGSFVIPTQGETEATVWYRIYLTVSDSKGLTNTKFVDIQPRKSIISLATQPAGLQVTLDGTPQTTPYSVTSVEGIERSIGVIATQTINNTTYQFSHWIHGGTQTQNINTSVNDVTYTAVFTTTQTQTPYGGTARNIPGKIEAEHYDLGGQGIAFNELSDGNSGSSFRTDNVDIQATTDVGGGYNIGWVSAGEWLEYTVNVTTSGTYNFEVRVAAIAAGKSLHIEMNGVNVTGAINVPNTNGWQSWQSVTIPNIALSSGQKIMRVVMDATDLNLNYINISLISNPQSPYGGTARNIPGKIEAEHYDLGGQGIAFNDITAGNSGTAFRNDNVDIEACNDVDGGFNIGWVSTGEWLEYTVNVLTSGSYNFQVRVATINTGRSFHIEMDGVNITGVIAVPYTGGWQNWQTVPISNITLSQGQKVMRVVMDANDFNINYINVVSASSSALKSQESEIVIQPNPAEDVLTISTEIEGPVTVKISIVNLAGTAMLVKEYQHIQGWFQETIDLRSIPSGNYILKVQKGSTVESKSLIIN